MSRDGLMTTEQVAARFGKSPVTIKQWRYEGRGPRYLKIGRHVRYRLEDLDSWLEAQSVDPSAA